MQALELLGEVHFLDTLRLLLLLVERFFGDIRLVERFLGEARRVERFLGEARRRVLRFGDAIITIAYKLFIFCMISSSLNSTMDILFRS